MVLLNLNKTLIYIIVSYMLYIVNIVLVLFKSYIASIMSVCVA